MSPLSFSVCSSTRSSAFEYDYERAVNTVQISVFSTDGNSRLGYLRLCDRAHGYVMLPAGGEITVFAMVNGPDMSGCTTVANYCGRTVGLADCSRRSETGFVMLNEPLRVPFPEGGADLSIRVSRPAARISLNSVTNSMNTGDSIIFERMFLIDFIFNMPVSIVNNYVSGAILPPASVLDGSFWADDLAWPEMSCTDMGNLEIPDGGSAGFATAPPSVYAMPNTGSANGSTPRTCAVIQGLIRGIRFYYPVAIPQLLAGRSYTMDLVINGPGSPDPHTPVSRSSLQVTIEDGGWLVGPECQEEI